MAMLDEEMEIVAEPKDASVTKMDEEFGRRAVPKMTAVPDGEDRVSTVEMVVLITGKTERKPVLFLVGSPLTVVRRAVESLLKNVSDMVLRGPTGGVVWSRERGRSVESRDVRPILGHIEKQAMPPLAPELATQTCDSLRILRR